MSITPEELAAMSDQQLDELRRSVLNARDSRVVEQRTQAQRQAERVRAAGVVHEEIRAYLRAGGDPEQLHALLDRVVAHLARERPAAAPAAPGGTSTPATPGKGAGGAASD